MKTVSRWHLVTVLMTVSLNQAFNRFVQNDLINSGKKQFYKWVTLNLIILE